MAVECPKAGNGRTIGAFCFVVVMSVCFWVFLIDHDPTGVGSDFQLSLEAVSINDAAVDNWAMNVHTNAGPRLGYSQGNQDAVLAYIFSQIGSGSRYFVEFGFSSSKYGQGTGANTELLFRQGWRGLLMDGQKKNNAINLHAEWISANTIVSTLEKYNVPQNFDYLSIDIDSADLWVFRAIISSSFRPRVVTVEYNSNYPIHSSFTNTGRPDYQWKGDRLFAYDMVHHWPHCKWSGRNLAMLLSTWYPVLMLCSFARMSFAAAPTPRSCPGKILQSVVSTPKCTPESVTAKGWVVDYAVWKQRKQMTDDILEGAMEELLEQRIPVIWDIPANTANYEDGGDVLYRDLLVTTLRLP